MFIAILFKPNDPVPATSSDSVAEYIFLQYTPLSDNELNIIFKYNGYNKISLSILKTLSGNSYDNLTVTFFNNGLLESAGSVSGFYKFYSTSFYNV